MIYNHLNDFLRNAHLGTRFIHDFQIATILNESMTPTFIRRLVTIAQRTEVFR